MTDSTYSGWANYETWCVNLWIDNDEGETDRWRERASELLEESSARWDFETDRDAALAALADAVMNSHKERASELGLLDGSKTGVFSDLVTAALGEVDWREIARAMLEAFES